MINLKEYIVTLVAMFLSLAIGIMVGTSITESVVVEQQKNIIEQLESRYYAALNDMDELNQAKESQQSLLHLYDQAAHQLVFIEDFNSLKGMEVGILSLDAHRGLEICDFLAGHGLKVNPHVYIESALNPDGGGYVSEYALKEVFLVAHQLLSGDIPASLPHIRYTGLAFAEPLQPEAFLLVTGGVSLENRQLSLLQEKVQGFPGHKLIILEDFFLENSIFTSLHGQDVRGIDFIDTAAGKIALLALLRGSEGVSALKPLAKGQP